jgi:hypothetical protein
VDFRAHGLGICRRQGVEMRQQYFRGTFDGLLEGGLFLCH